MKMFAVRLFIGWCLRWHYSPW